MFSGIVQGQAEIVEVIPGNEAVTFGIVFPPGFTEGLKMGASVSIDGTCLTVASIKDTLYYFDVISETLTRTTLGNLKKGSRVNFERSLKWGDEVGGHLLSGHVFTTGIIVNISKHPGETMMRIRFPIHLKKYVFPKGYIAIDGISLTLGQVDPDSFTLHLIPETLKITTLSSKKEGDAVNIEIDSQTQVIVDTVERIKGT